VRGLSYSTAGAILTRTDTCKILIFNNSLYIAAPSSSPPGVGVHLMGSIGKVYHRRSQTALVSCVSCREYLMPVLLADLADLWNSNEHARHDQHND